MNRSHTKNSTKRSWYISITMEEISLWGTSGTRWTFTELIYSSFCWDHRCTSMANTKVPPASLLLPSQLDHDNPLHPGNMSSLIRLVSAALEKPQAPCGGEGPEREASVAERAAPARSGRRAAWWQNSNGSSRGNNVEMMQDNDGEREETRPFNSSTFQWYINTLTAALRW